LAKREKGRAPVSVRRKVYPNNKGVTRERGEIMTEETAFFSITRGTNGLSWSLYQVRGEGERRKSPGELKDQYTGISRERRKGVC